MGPHDAHRSRAARANCRMLAPVVALLVTLAPSLTSASERERFAGIEQALRIGDLASAAKLLAPMADRGDSEAQYRLAALIRSGRVADASAERAFALMRKSADAGQRRARIDLAAMYRDGYGTRRDLAKARTLLQRSVEAGDAEAIRALADLERVAGVPRAAPAPQWAARVTRRDQAGSSPASSSDGNTAAIAAPLLQAAQRGLEAPVEALLAAGAETSVKDGDGRTPLMLAAAGGHAKVVERLLAAGATIDVPSSNGETALILAARNGHGEIVRRLVAGGADARLRDNAATDALAAAVTACQVETVAVLVGTTKAVSEKRKGTTLLHEAAQDCPAAIVKRLGEAGAAIDGTDDKGRTALWVAADAGNAPVAAELLAKGARAMVDATGDTPLHRAASGGYTEIARALVRANAPVGPANEAGNTALMLAAYAGADAIVDLLIAGKADVDYRNANGMSALMLAAKAGHVRVAERLVAAGADASLRNIRREQAVDVARVSGHAELAERLAAQ